MTFINACINLLFKEDCLDSYVSGHSNFSLILLGIVSFLWVPGNFLILRISDHEQNFIQVLLFLK